METTNKKYFLDFYIASIKAKKLTDPYDSANDISALCDYFRVHAQVGDIFELLMPTDEDYNQLGIEGKSLSIWASDVPFYNPYEFYVFNKLRQNLVLLGACLNNEFDDDDTNE